MTASAHIIQLRARQPIMAGERGRASLRWLIPPAALFASYCLALVALAPMSAATILSTAAANTAPLVPLSALARQVWLRLRSSPAALFITVQIVTGALFAITWYWSVAVLLGLFAGETQQGFFVQPFKSGALPWQLLQGVLAYAFVCALSETWWYPRPMSDAGAITATREPGLLLVKVADEIVPVHPGDIIMISGAQDYCEIQCRNGSVLSRMSLHEFELMLPPTSFLRIHRSHIVNLERLVRAEPAGGGRLTLHLESGYSVTSSRNGARGLRTRLL